jgi:hypothetical protein
LECEALGQTPTGSAALYLAFFILALRAGVLSDSNAEVDAVFGGLRGVQRHFELLRRGFSKINFELDIL